MTRVGAILRALGWRWGVLWWAPTAVFLLVALLMRAQVAGWTPEPGYFSHDEQTAATLYCYLTLAQVIALWLRARFALSLGHTRGPVFTVLAVVTPLLITAQSLFNAVVTRLEALALGGLEGILVTSAGGGKVVDPGLPPFVGVGQVLFMLYGPFLAMGIALTMSLVLRWGLGWVVAILPMIVLAYVGAVAIAATVPWSLIPAVSPVVAAAPISLGWVAFRRQPV